MIKGIAFRIFAVLLSFLGTLVVMEGAFRLLDIRPEVHEPRKDLYLDARGLSETVHYRAPNSIILSRYDSDPRGYFGPENEIRHEHNSLGFRDEEHTHAKPPGVVRIVGLGDSFLWGQGVKREDICLNVLARKLGKGRPNIEVEPINISVSGLDTVAERYLLEKIGLRYSPDLVIIHFVPNDINQSVDLYSGEFNKISRPAEAGGSYLWRWVKHRYDVMVTARTYISDVVSTALEKEEDWRKTQDALDGIHFLCREREIPLLVAIFPFFFELDDRYPFQPIHELVVEHCRVRGIEVIDLKPFFEGFHGPELWVHPVDQHPNEVAHAIAADAIHEAAASLLKLDRNP